MTFSNSQQLPGFFRKALRPFSVPIKAAVVRPVALCYRKIYPGLLDHALTAFVYHDVSDEPSEFSSNYDLNVPPALFEYQLGLIKNNFNIITPDDLLMPPIPQKAALITFDDGFRSFFTNVIPILEKNQVPCIIFLNLGPIKGEIFWSGLITYLCEKAPDFVQYLKNNISTKSTKFPLYLSCSADIVNSYLEKTGKDFSSRVSKFTGEFAREQDLQAATKDFVYFGNHLFNHHVPLLMSDNNLLDSFRRNSNELEEYPNYRSMFSFPFGQPGSCFSERQVDLLIANGAKKVFRSSGSVNYDPCAAYLDRIALTSWHDSSDKIFFQVFRHRLRGLL